MSSLQHHGRVQQALGGAFPLESSKVLLVTQGATLARFVGARPTAPRDESDTQLQGEAVDETDALNLVFDAVLGRMSGGLLHAGRKCCIHEGVLCGTGRDENRTGRPRFAAKGCAEAL